MRRAFTLIELLVVIAMLGAMATIGIISFSGGRGSLQTSSAARDVLAMVRRARAVALVTKKPVLVTYSNEGTGSDGERCAQIAVKSDKLFNSHRALGRVQTLSGETVREAEAEVEAGEGNGETIEDILSPDGIPPDVLSGLRLKVLTADEELVAESAKHASKISIFSTADAVARSYDARQAAAAETAGDAQAAADAAAADAATESPVQVVFAANGTVDPPHRIWIYPDGSSPEKGLCVEVDRYGDVSCQEVEGE